LDRCYDGCSTPFKDVGLGRNTVSIKKDRGSSWGSIGAFGGFKKCKHYAVNIISNNGALCAELAVREQTDSTYNNDRTKRIIANTCE
jgi:hypothetical protein